MSKGLALAIVAATSAGSAAVGAKAEPQALPYLADVLEKPAYKASFAKMLRGQKVAEWVQNFIATKNGVASPGEVRTVGGVPYEEYDVCEPHNCGGNFLFVVFAPGGREAWGLFIQDGRTVRYYGRANAAVRQTLDKAAALQR